MLIGESADRSVPIRWHANTFWTGTVREGILRRPLFNDLLRRRKPARYVAFDLLWLSGVDWRERSLVLRRQELRAVIPAAMPRIWMAHMVVKQGKALFAEACRHDLEGIVAKWMPAPYGLLNGRSPWVKIKNPRYSQAVVSGKHRVSMPSIRAAS